MPEQSISCHINGSCEPENISDKGLINNFLSQLGNLCRSTTDAGSNSTQYWADIAVKSDHPLAPLAHIPGVFAALWTPETAPTTAITLSTAGYGFAALPKNLIHFTTTQGARGIATSGTVKSTGFGLFGPGAYMTKVGRPVNLFVQAKARTPISLATPKGTARIIPYLVYVRWGVSPIILP